MPKEKEPKKKRWYVIEGLVIALILMIQCSRYSKSIEIPIVDEEKNCLNKINEVILDYNILASEYNELIIDYHLQENLTMWKKFIPCGDEGGE